MARLSKYNEPTEVFSVKVPKSQKEAVSKLVDEFLNQFLRNKNDGVDKPMLEAYKSTFKGVQEDIVKNQPKTKIESEKVVLVSGNELKSIVEFNELNEVSKDIITQIKSINKETLIDSNRNECGCYLDGILLKRSKGSKCKKTKNEHNF